MAVCPAKPATASAVRVLMERVVVAERSGQDELSTVRLIDVPSIESQTPGAVGTISVLTGGEACPFEIKRLYWIHGARLGEIRGGHAHKQLHQLMVAVSGSFEITISSGGQSAVFLLDSPLVGLVVGPGFWRTIRTSSEKAVLLVAASAAYDESDYIRSRAAFRAYRKSLCENASEATSRE